MCIDDGYGTWELNNPSGSLPNSQVIKDTPVTITDEVLSNEKSLGDKSTAALEITSGFEQSIKEDDSYLNNLLDTGQDGHTVHKDDDYDDDNCALNAKDRESVWCAPSIQCTDLDSSLRKPVVFGVQQHYNTENSVGDKNSAALEILTLVGCDTCTSDVMSDSELVIASRPQPVPSFPDELIIDELLLANYQTPDYKPFNCSLGGDT